MLIDESEVTTLAARYGEPLRWSRTLDVSRKTLGERRKSLAKRRGEIVLAVLRPGGRVLLHIKDFYPAGAFRLLSGGIEIGERVEAAAGRELAEETGLRVAPQRLLGIVDYEFRSSAETAEFASYIFLTPETGAAPHPEDTHERIAEFREVPWSTLEETARRLEQLPDDWNDWGRFRAIPHRMAAQFQI